MSKLRATAAPTERVSSLRRLAAVAAIGAVVACARPAPFDDAPARAAVSRAIRSLGTDDRQAAERLERIQAAAERAAEAQAKSPGGVAAAWTPALVAARRELAAKSLRERSQAERWAELDPVATAAVTRAREQAAAPGIGRKQAQRLAARSAAELGLARRHAVAGRFDRASAAAERALALAGEIDASWRALYQRFGEPESLRQWRRWVDETLATSRASGAAAIVVGKLERRLWLYSGGREVASFEVELGSRGLRRKLHAGDRATPEGLYRVAVKKAAPATRYYKALLLDYPNGDDRRRYQEARSRRELPAGVGIGNLIEVHGHGGRGTDWTDGCVALTDEDMDRLYQRVKVGTPVTIVGTVPKR